MPIYILYIDITDGQTRERTEVSGTKMRVPTIIKRPDQSELKYEQN